MGDFNSILSTKDTEANYNDKKCPELKDLIANFNYSDAYRMFNPDGRDYTFFRPSCAPSRLDRFYIPQNLVSSVKNVSHQASLGDHLGVSLLMSIEDLENLTSPTISSSPYWKLNTSILKDD